MSFREIDEMNERKEKADTKAKVLASIYNVKLNKERLENQFFYNEFIIGGVSENEFDIELDMFMKGGEY